MAAQLMAVSGSLLNVDSRMQQRVAAAASAVGLITGEVIMCIPVSIMGKNIYFDRKTPTKP